MGKTLNNPKVVLPLAGAAALFLVYRIVPEAFDLDRYLPKSDIKQLMDHKAAVDCHLSGSWDARDETVCSGSLDVECSGKTGVARRRPFLFL